MSASVSEAWIVASALCAAAWNVPVEAVRAPSRGRGPRPPEEVREPRIVAIHLAVTMSGCAYADLGRHLAMHRDTIASHCAAVRERTLEDAQFEALSEALEKAAAVRLGRPKPSDRRPHRRVALNAATVRSSAEEIIGFLRTHNQSFGVAANTHSSDEAPSSDSARFIRQKAPSSDKIVEVIENIEARRMKRGRAA